MLSLLITESNTRRPPLRFIHLTLFSSSVTQIDGRSRAFYIAKELVDSEQLWASTHGNFPIWTLIQHSITQEMRCMLMLSFCGLVDRISLSPVPIHQVACKVTANYNTNNFPTSPDRSVLCCILFASCKIKCDTCVTIFLEAILTFPIFFFFSPDMSASSSTSKR